MNKEQHIYLISSKFKTMLNNNLIQWGDIDLYYNNLDQLVKDLITPIPYYYRIWIANVSVNDSFFLKIKDNVIQYLDVYDVYSEEAIIKWFGKNHEKQFNNGDVLYYWLRKTNNALLAAAIVDNFYSSRPHELDNIELTN